MDVGYENEAFETFKLKSSVAKKFRKFCKNHAKSQSMTLSEMLEFFEVNEVSPDTRLGETISSLKDQYKKRSNAIIAIIKNIEKSQTKPTTAMLQKLFENAAREEEEDEFDFGTPQMISENEELKQYKKAYDELKKINYTMRNALNHIYANTHYVKGNFGKGYYKLNMSQEKFNELNKLIHVHHH